MIRKMLILRNLLEISKSSWMCHLKINSELEFENSMYGFIPCVYFLLGIKKLLNLFMYQ